MPGGLKVSPAVYLGVLEQALLKKNKHSKYIVLKRFFMLVITGFFENGKFVPDAPVLLPEKTRAVIRVENADDTLPVISKEAWFKFRKELEAIEGEEIPDDFAERFKMTNFRAPEELGL
jgi:hypothetical protein